MLARSLGLGVAAFVACSLALHAGTLWALLLWPELIGELQQLIAVTDMLGLGAWAGALHLSTELARRSGGARLRWFLLMAGVWSLAIYPALASGVLLRPTGPGGDLPTAWMETFKEIAPAWWPGTLFGALCWSGTIPLLAVGLLRLAPRRPPAWAQTLVAVLASQPGLALMTRHADKVECWERFRPLLLLGAPLAVAVVAWGERWLDALEREPPVDRRRGVPTLIRFARAARPASWTRSVVGWGVVALVITVCGARHTEHLGRLAVAEGWDRELDALGPAALPALRDALLQERREWTRERVLHRLCGDVRFGEGEVESALEAGLVDLAPRLRAFAVSRCADSNRLPRFRARLAAILVRDAAPDVRVSVAHALRASPDPGDLAALANALERDGDPRVRLAALTAWFGPRIRPGALEAWRAAVRRAPPGRARLDVIDLLLKRIYLPGALEALWEAAREDPEAGRRILASVHHGFPGATWSLLQELVRAAPEEAVSLLATLVELHLVPRAQQLLRRGLDERDPVIRRATARLVVELERDGQWAPRFGGGVDVDLLRAILLDAAGSADQAPPPSPLPATDEEVLRSLPPFDPGGE